MYNLIVEFKSKFYSDVWLTDRQIKSFFSRARAAAKNKIHDDELDRKKEEWKQELLKNHTDIANDGETSMKRKSEKNHPSRKFSRHDHSDDDTIMDDAPTSSLLD